MWYEWLRKNDFFRIDVHLSALAACVLVALPLVGFIGGIICCEDCSTFGHYLLMGLIHAVITTLAFGHMWMAHDRLESVWHLVIPVSLGFWCLYTFIVRPWLDRRHD